MLPNTKHEWQFGIRATNGKLVGVVLAYPLCISIGGVYVSMEQLVMYHPKCVGKQLQYMLIKELVRRVNICNINHLVLIVNHNSMLKPITEQHVWDYTFDHPMNSQLPSSPRTPGWRRMTLEDVPSVFALVNKWSSQFEIRQVFSSEEEFLIHYVCPTITNFVHTYVVEGKTNNITDFISFRLTTTQPNGTIIAVVPTQSPVNLLITDALVCAIKFGVKRWRYHNML